MTTRSRNISQHKSPPPGEAPARGGAPRKPGPAVDIDRVREAATLVLEGVPMKDVLQIVGVDRTTLWRWRQLPVWAETTADHARQVREQLLPLAHQVIVECLRADLGLVRRRPNPKLALEVLDRLDPAVIRAQGGEGTGGPIMGQAVTIYLPDKTEGVRSRPPTEVLAEGETIPDPPAAGPRSEGTRGKGKMRRRAALADENE